MVRRFTPWFAHPWTVAIRKNSTTCQLLIQCIDHILEDGAQPGRMLCYTGTLAETSTPLSYQDSCLWVMWLMVRSEALLVIGLLVHLCCPEMILLLGDKVVWDTMLMRSGTGDAGRGTMGRQGKPLFGLSVPVRRNLLATSKMEEVQCNWSNTKSWLVSPWMVPYWRFGVSPHCW